MTRTGLVLGGGGITGIAWEIGLLKGLRDHGVDLSAADLAVGCDAVVTIAPLARAFSRHHTLSAQLTRTGASRSTAVTPDAAALEAIGKNVLDPAKREAAAEAGRVQAASAVDRVREAWPALDG